MTSWTAARRMEGAVRYWGPPLKYCGNCLSSKSRFVSHSKDQSPGIALPIGTESRQMALSLSWTLSHGNHFVASQ